MPPRPRSHSYTGPPTAKETKEGPSEFEVPHQPVLAHIRPADRAAHNLRVLRRHDPTIISIVEQIPYAALRLLQPGRPEFWQEKLEGPEGPLFMVERQVGKAEPTLAFVILNVKTLPSWVQPMHLEDEIEFSPETIFIVPRSRKHVMWPVIDLGASKGLYALYIIRLVARAHLLARYRLRWPDKWRPKLEENEGPMREQDILKLFMTDPRIAEVERIADEIVAVVLAGGSWCRGQCEPSEIGWPQNWVEPIGSTEDVWKEYGIEDVKKDANPTVVLSIEDKSTTHPQPVTPRKGQKARQSKGTNRDLKEDVVQSLLDNPAEFKPPRSSLAPPARIEDAGRTPTPSDFQVPLPTDTVEISTGRSPRPRQKNKKSRNGNTGTPVDKLRNAAQPNAQIQRLPTPGPPRVGTPAFGLVDDRASDSDDEPLEGTSGSPSPPPIPEVNGKSIGQSKTNGVNGTETKQVINGVQKVLKYHERGYIPHNSPPPDNRSLLDTDIARDSITSAVLQKERTRFTGLERNDWVRELLSLIHTNKEFVDGLYNDYKSKSSS